MNEAPAAVGDTVWVRRGIPGYPRSGAADWKPAGAETPHALQDRAVDLLERIRLEIVRGTLTVATTESVVAVLDNALRGVVPGDEDPRIWAGTDAQKFYSPGALTAAEHEVLCLIKQGQSAKQIAFARRSRVSTVRTQIAAILGKMNFRSQRELLANTVTFERVGMQGLSLDQSSTALQVRSKQSPGAT